MQSIESSQGRGSPVLNQHSIISNKLHAIYHLQCEFFNWKTIQERNMDKLFVLRFFIDNAYIYGLFDVLCRYIQLGFFGTFVDAPLVFLGHIYSFHCKFYCLNDV